MQSNGGDRTDLATTFADMARALLAEGDVQRTLQKVVDLAVVTLEGCDHAGVSIVRGRSVSTPAASDEVPVRADAIQYETDSGPCLDAMRDHEVFHVDDLRDEVRWPAFSRRAAEETGVRSMLSFRLFVADQTLGALNLYSDSVAAFSGAGAGSARQIGAVFAAHAAVALANAQHDEDMRQALQSRDVIGQAKGMLMANADIDEDQAFAMLKAASQRMNVKLRDVAERVASRQPMVPAPGEQLPAS